MSLFKSTDLRRICYLEKKVVLIIKLPLCLVSTTLYRNRSTTSSFSHVLKVTLAGRKWLHSGRNQFTPGNRLPITNWIRSSVEPSGEKIVGMCVVMLYEKKTHYCWFV
jgi:hypothetical protein